MPSGVSQGCAAVTAAASALSAKSTLVKSGIWTIGLILESKGRRTLSCSAAKVESSTQWLLDLQAKLLNQLTKLNVISVHEFRQLLWAARHRLEPALLQALLEFGIGGDLHYVCVELLHNRGRRAARHQHRKPQADIDAGQAGLGEGGHVRQAVHPARGGDCERP